MEASSSPSHTCQMKGGDEKLCNAPQRTPDVASLRFVWPACLPSFGKTVLSSIRCPQKRAKARASSLSPATGHRHTMPSASACSSSPSHLGVGSTGIDLLAVGAFVSSRRYCNLQRVRGFLRIATKHELRGVRTRHWRRPLGYLSLATAVQRSRSKGTWTRLEFVGFGAWSSLLTSAA